MYKHYILISGTLLAVIASSHISAKDFTVNSLADAVDAEAGNGQCGTAEAQCTLRAAIQEANALPGDDAIVLPPGTYPLDLTGSGENKAAKGDLDIVENLTLSGEDPATTIIDGMGADRIFDIYRASANQDTRVEMSGITLIRGTVRVDGSHGGAISSFGTLHLRNAVLEDNAVAGIGAHGGALCNRGGTMTLEDVAIRRNKARTNGGGLCNLDGGTAYLANVEVKDNATDQDGSNHHHGGALVSNGTLIVRNSVIAQNRSHYGGGAFLTAGLANFENVTFDANRSILHGGGLHVGSHDQDGAPAAVDLTVTRSTISGNELTEGGSTGHGGGLFITAQSAVYIHETKISRNSARGPCTACSIDGGGLYNDTGNVTLNRVTLEGNRAARFGGAIYNNTGRSLRIVASTLRENRANQGGGGLAAENAQSNDGTPTTTIEYSLVAYNRAPNGGGIAGSAVLRNTTVWGNTAYVAGAGSGNGGAIYIPESGAASGSGTIYLYRTELINVTVGMNTAAAEGAQLNNAGGILRLQGSLVARPEGTMNCVGRVDTLGYNIDSDGSCGLAASGDNQVDPKLEDLADNGGPTLGAAPAADSPAIAAMSAGECQLLDQRLFLRGAEGCDAGALEVGASAPVSGAVTFAADTLEASAENSDPLVLDIERRDGREGPASVDYIIRGAAAVDSSDASSRRGTLSWAAGDAKSKTLTVRWLDDVKPEDRSALSVELRNPVGATLGAFPVLNVNILESPPGNSGNPEPPTPPESGESGGGVLAGSVLTLLAAAWRRRRAITSSR